MIAISEGNVVNGVGNGECLTVIGMIALVDVIVFGCIGFGGSVGYITGTIVFGTYIFFLITLRVLIFYIS